MGLCYSLRPLLFGSSGDAPCEDSEPCAEDAQPSAAPAPAPAPIPAPAPVGTLLRRGDGRIPASARSPVELQNRRRQEQLRAEEREAAKEARKVSRGIDRMLREQKRDLQQTHRLLLLEIHLLPPNCWDQRHVLPHPARLFLEQLSVAMAEVQQLQVQEAVNAMVKSVERENIWKMQDLVFRCSANRCEGTQASMQQVHQCIEHCHAPVAQGQALVTSNLERFQDHLA